MSDLHNYKVFHGGKILSVKTAKLRLIFNKNYLPEVRCCSFSVLCVLLADLGRFSWVLCAIENQYPRTWPTQMLLENMNSKWRFPSAFLKQATLVNGND